MDIQFCLRLLECQVPPHRQDFLRWVQNNDTFLRRMKGRLHTDEFTLPPLWLLVLTRIIDIGCVGYCSFDHLTSRAVLAVCGRGRQSGEQ